MSDAPERIWIARAWAETFVAHDERENVVEFVRADLAAADTDARLAVALAYQRAADAIEANPQPCSPAYPSAWTDDQIAHYESGQLDAANSFQTAILAHANSDALAELNALRAALTDVTKALEGFVDTSTERRQPYDHPLSAYDRAMDLLTPTTQAQEGENG